MRVVVICALGLTLDSPQSVLALREQMATVPVARTFNKEAARTTTTTSSRGTVHRRRRAWWNESWRGGRRRVTQQQQQQQQQQQDEHRDAGGKEETNEPGQQQERHAQHPDDDVRTSTMPRGTHQPEAGAIEERQPATTVGSEALTNTEKGEIETKQPSPDPPSSKNQRRRRRRLPISDSAAAAVAAPPSLSTLSSSISSAVNRLLRHPQLGRWTLTGVQLGLVLYLVQGMWTAASELMDEFHADRDASPTYLQRTVVSQILQELDNGATTQPPTTTASKHGSTALSKNNNINGNTSKPSVLAQQPVLAHLSKTLLASGMPLRASSESPSSMEQVLLSLTQAEVLLLQQSLWTKPSLSIDSNGGPTHWNDVCGLEPVKESLLDLLWTWKHRDQGSTINPYRRLVKRPPGVLLYGPPGCGKTLLVKAIASEARLPCLIVTPSLLLRKYVGDTNLQVRTLFQLAEKLSPCILCLDELDGLFRERSSTEHDVSRDLKTEFLQWWDGIASSEHSRILVVGSTNRPFDLDVAVLRRMPQSYFVGLPHYEARMEVLEHLTKGIPLDPSFVLEPLASKTEGYTPSDLHQVIQTAVTVGPIRESRMTQLFRALTTKDIMYAKSKVGPTPLTPSYRNALIEYAQRDQAIPGEAMEYQARNSESNDNNVWASYFDAGTVHAELDTGTSTPSLESDDHTPFDWTDEDAMECDTAYDELQTDSEADVE